MKSPKRKRRDVSRTDQGADRSSGGESTSFPVVGVGASAGGLEAFTDLLRHLQESIQRAEELRIANAELLESEQRKNQFLAMLSHELRNPLAPISNGLYILNHVAPDSEEAGRARAVMGRQIGQLTRLVDDLLDATRLTHGKVQLRRVPLDLVDVVRRTVEDHRSSFVEKSLEIETNIPNEAIRVEADRARLAQVIGNLLNNAVKFSLHGGKITVSVARDDDEVVVRVRDTGTGIAHDMLSSIFNPFTQVDTSIDRAKGGLGLGLSLVKGIIEMHGGSVSADERRRGKGFGVRLQVADRVWLGALEHPADRRAPGRVLPSASSSSTITSTERSAFATCFA